MPSACGRTFRLAFSFSSGEPHNPLGCQALLLLKALSATIMHACLRCDVLAMLQDREKPGHKIEVDEEFEDAEGNVYNRKTYEDLKRQGLI